MLHGKKAMATKAKAVGKGKSVTHFGLAPIKQEGKKPAYTRQEIREYALSKQPAPDSVNNPSHYTQGAVECIDAIESALGPTGFLEFLRGQVIKYTWRMSSKGNPLQDGQKAQWYQNLLVKKLATAAGKGDV